MLSFSKEIIRKKILVYLLISKVTNASIAFIDYVDYQQFKDFAENKGNFRLDNSAIKIQRKDGSITMLPYRLPDFAVADSYLAVGTVLSPTYIGSVKHNGSYTTVSYGQKAGHEYGIIDRNDHSRQDLHTPRLNKVVTEVAPAYIDYTTGSVYNYGKDFELFVRIGTGTQYIDENNNRQWVAGAYEYRTGGTLYPSEYYWNNNDKFAITSENGKRNPNNLMHTMVQPGDSGSPIWGYHKEQKRWMLLGFGQSGSAIAINYEIFDKQFFKDREKEDTLPEIENKNGNTEFVWEAIEGTENTGVGYITQGNNKWQYNGLKTDYDINKNKFDKNSQFIRDLNTTKHIIFSGDDGTIKLKDSINMGAGMLTFKSNYTVTSDTKDKTWVGAGILVEKDKTVTWEVNGVDKDYLHKIGEGTLIAQGNGDNKGSLNIGDGTVILNQNGGKAFENIDIVSGRGTVQIGNQENANRLDTSKIYFGFRGGRLDLNGFNLSFGDIRATDKGAKIVNSTDKKVTVTVDSSKFKKESSIFHGQFGEESKASKMDVALTNTMDKNKNFGITGGINIEGDIVQDKNTTIILAGEYEIPAGKDINKIKENGYFYTNTFKFNKVTIGEGSEFQGGVYSDITGDVETTGNNKIVLGYIENETKYMYDLGQETKEQKASLETLKSNDKFRKITTLYKGNISLKSNSKLMVGYAALTGDIISDNSSTNISNSILDGNIKLSNKSSFISKEASIKGDIIQTGDNQEVALTDTIFSGKVENKGKENLLSLNKSTWNIMNNSLVSTLKLDKSNLLFGDQSSRSNSIDFYTLTTENLDGNGTITFRVDLSTNKNDKLAIKGDTNNSTLTILADNVTGDNGVQLGEYLPLIDTNDKASLNLISGSGDKYVTIGPVKGKLDKNGNIVIPTKEELNKETTKYTSDMTNAALADYTAKVNLVKSQKDLIDNILSEVSDNIEKTGISYIGNFSYRSYKSDKFDKFSQNILNNSISYQKELYEGKKWNSYIGGSFIYGIADAKYRGDYSGGLESFTGAIFTKLANKNGFYLNSSLSGSYMKNKINSETVKKLLGGTGTELSIDDYDTLNGVLGLGIGYERKYNNFKLGALLDTTGYYLKGNSYRLHDPTAYTLKTTSLVKTDDEILLQLSPKLKAEYEYGYKGIKFTTFGKVGYDYNKYLLHTTPELQIVNIATETGLIENGVKLEAGVGIEFLSTKISLELVHFSGENNTKNLFGNIRIRYLF